MSNLSPIIFLFHSVFDSAEAREEFIYTLFKKLRANDFNA